MKILVCEPGKHPYVKDIPHELHEMQAVVGGLIQALYFEDNDSVAAICNEEGLFLDLDWNRVVAPYGPVKGTFFICGIDFDSFCGLTDAQIEKYKARFWDPEMLIPTPDGMARIIVKEI